MVVSAPNCFASDFDTLFSQLLPMATASVKHSLPKPISVLTTVDVPEPSPTTPASAISKVVYCGSTFASKEIIIAKGYYALILDDAPSVLELYLHRVRRDPLRVAQLCADADIDFDMKAKIVTLRDEDSRIDAGRLAISDVSSWYFLSQSVL